jgi:type I restriction enzyme S subunit
MSSETIASTMKQEETPILEPKLRFPQFHGATLRSVLLGDVTEECRSRNGNKHTAASVMGVTKAEGIVPMETRLIAADTTRYKLVETDWFAYNPMRLNIGSIARWEGEQEILVSPDSVVFKCITNNDLGCAPSYLDQFRHAKTWDEFVTEGGDGSVRVRIYYKDIARIGLTLPSLPEQQKIAACLSSLDELIAVQAQKVEALKTHKQGLMQQLFPREGEAQPRIRFPEFQSTGEWEEMPFVELCDIKHGYAFESKFFSNAGDYVLLTPGNFFEQGGYRDRGELQKYFTGDIPPDYVLAKGDMLVAMTEQATGLLGSPILVPESNKFLHNQRLGLVVKRLGIAWANKFFFHIFNTQRVRKAIHNTASGAKVRHTSPTKIGAVVVSVPTSLPEQHRIASCLSSLDALISAESKRLNALKTHKKGLTQQLFPSPKEPEE